MSLLRKRSSLGLVVGICALALPLVVGAAAAGPAAAAGWEEQVSGAGSDCWLEDVCAISADEAWTAGSTPSAVLHTTDGGANWFSVDPGISGDIESMAFVGDSGWVAAYDDGTSHMYDVHTTDGGQTWADVPPAAATGTVDRFLPISDDVCWGWHHLGNAPPKAQLLLTTDGGVNWAGNAAWTAGGYAMPTAGSFFSAQTGWFLADDMVYRTTDGGGSWASSDPAPPSYASYLSDVDFVSATTGWVAGADGFVARTTDGGQTWAPVAPLPVSQFYGIDFISTTVGWAIGSNGSHSTIWYTSDGGVTWGAQLYTTTRIDLDIAAGDPTHAWITGTQGMILHTGDGGGPVDVTAPTVSVIGPSGWIGGPSAFTIGVVDSGIGAWKAEWKWETDLNWKWAWAPAGVPVATPADHSADGLHTLTYRGADWANNRSVEQTSQVGVDTQAPTAKAPAPAKVRRGRSVSLKYEILDPLPNGGHGSALIKIRNRAGKVVAKSPWQAYKAVNTVVPWQFKCKLKKGTYKFFVTVCDEAGNLAVRQASNRLTVR